MTHAVVVLLAISGLAFSPPPQSLSRPARTLAARAVPRDGFAVGSALGGREALRQPPRPGAGGQDVSGLFGGRLHLFLHLEHPQQGRLDLGGRQAPQGSVRTAAGAAAPLAAPDAPPRPYHALKVSQNKGGFLKN